MGCIVGVELFQGAQDWIITTQGKYLIKWLQDRTFDSQAEDVCKIRSINKSPDSRQLITINERHTLKIWGILHFQELLEVTLHSVLHSIKILNQQNLLVGADECGKLIFYSLSQRELLI